MPLLSALNAGAADCAGVKSSPAGDLWDFYGMEVGTGLRGFVLNISPISSAVGSQS